MIEGFILAGGASSRMGVDKAHLRLGGLTLVERVAQSLSIIAESITVVSSKEGGDAWGFPSSLTCLPDGARSADPFGIRSRPHRLIAVVSCDLPL